MARKKSRKRKYDLIGTGVIIGIMTIVLSVFLLGILSAAVSSEKLSLERGEGAVAAIALIMSLAGGLTGRALIKEDKWRIIAVVGITALILKALISLIINSHAAQETNIWTYAAMAIGFAASGFMPIKAQKRRQT